MNETERHLKKIVTKLLLFGICEGNGNEDNDNCKDTQMCYLPSRIGENSKLPGCFLAGGSTTP